MVRPASMPNRSQAPAAVQRKIAGIEPIVRRSALAPSRHAPSRTGRTERGECPPATDIFLRQSGRLPDALLALSVKGHTVLSGQSIAQVAVTPKADGQVDGLSSELAPNSWTINGEI